MSGSSTWSRSSQKEGARGEAGLRRLTTLRTASHWLVCLLESYTTVLAQVYLWTSNTIELVGACLLVLSVQPVLVYLQSAIVHGLVCLLASRMIAPAFLMTQRLPLQSLFRWSTLSRAWGLPARPVCLFAWCWNAIVWCFLH